MHRTPQIPGCGGSGSEASGSAGAISQAREVELTLCSTTAEVSTGGSSHDARTRLLLMIWRSMGKLQKARNNICNMLDAHWHSFVSPNAALIRQMEIKPSIARAHARAISIMSYSEQRSNAGRYSNLTRQENFAFADVDLCLQTQTASTIDHGTRLLSWLL